MPGSQRGGSLRKTCSPKHLHTGATCMLAIQHVHTENKRSKKHGSERTINQVTSLRGKKLFILWDAWSCMLAKQQVQNQREVIKTCKRPLKSSHFPEVGLRWGEMVHIPLSSAPPIQRQYIKIAPEKKTNGSLEAHWKKRGYTGFLDDSTG